MKYLNEKLTQRIDCDPIPVGHYYFPHFTQSGEVAFAISRKNDFVYDCKSFKKGLFHDAIFKWSFTIFFNPYL